MKRLLILIWLLLPILSFSQIIENNDYNYSHFDSIQIKGEIFKIYPERWDIGYDNHLYFKDSIPDGKYIVYSYDTNRISLILEYKNYKQVSVQIFREDNSSQFFNIITKRELFFDNKNRLYEEYSIVNDTLRLILNIYDTLGNKQVEDGNGNYIFYDENGKKLCEGGVKNGLNEGKYTHWYENGKKSETGYFKDGIRIGKWKKWDENGKKIKEKKVGIRDEEINRYRGVFIKGIKFDPTLKFLDTSSYKKLDKVLPLMKDTKISRIEIYYFSAYPDNANKHEWSNSITDYLIKNGVDSSKLLCITHSNLLPLICEAKLNKIKNKKRQNKLRAKNQRVEYKIFYK